MLAYVTEDGLIPVNSTDDIINHKEVLKNHAKKKAIETLDKIIDKLEQKEFH